MEFLNMQMNVKKAKVLMTYLPQRPDYDMWIKVISSVGNYFSDTDALDIILSHWSDEKPNETEYKIKQKLRNYDIGTLIYYAKYYGYIPHKNEFTNNINKKLKCSNKKISSAIQVKSYNRENCITDVNNDYIFDADKYPVAINTQIINKGICRHTGEIEDFGWLTKYFSNAYLSANELIAHIAVGHPVIFGHFKQENREFIPDIKHKNWLYSKMFAIDIDNGLTLDDALNMKLSKKAVFIYTTHSHTEKLNKYRIVFDMNGIIDDENSFKEITSAYISEYDADIACKNVNRIFYGNNNAHIIIPNNY
jgi:hypothetical protein